jgi:hypothetical protein
MALKVLAAAALLASASVASATPSTVVWTPATIYTQPFLIPHITYDTYLGERQMLQETLGLTVGFVPDNKWVEGEVGADVLYPLFPTSTGSNAGKVESKSAFLFNGKLSLKEGSLHEYAPGLSVGAYGLGLTKDLTDYNILYAVIGKTFGPYGTLAVGGYTGNDKVLVKVDAAGTVKKDESGFLVSYASPKLNVGATGLKDISVGLDYQSGDNAFGAFGAAVTFYFTDAISLLTGPVIFNDKFAAAGLNVNKYAPPTPGNTLVWTVQLDVDIDFSKAKPAAPAGKS